MTREQELVALMSDSIGNRHVNPKFNYGILVLITSSCPDIQPKSQSMIQEWINIYNIAVRHGFVDC